jgi:hypothetical protein
LRVQKTRWSCADCGTRFTWYAQVCKVCGGELYSCRDEEKDIESLPPTSAKNKNTLGELDPNACSTDIGQKKKTCYTDCITPHSTEGYIPGPGGCST